MDIHMKYQTMASFCGTVTVSQLKCKIEVRIWNGFMKMIKKFYLLRCLLIFCNVGSPF